MFFPHRMPEPKIMEQVELDAFGEASAVNYKRWLIPLVDEALEKANLQKGKVLDIGCGPGLLTKEVASRSQEFHVSCVDISPYAIELAKKNCKNLRNISFKIGSVDNLPFADNGFDLVLCKDSFHEFPHPKQALKEILRVVKPNGLLYLQDLRRDLPMYLLSRSIPPDTVFKKLQYYSTRASYTKDEVRNMCEGLKFKHVSIRTRKLTKFLRRRYEVQGINIEELRASFQARYVLMVKKILRY